MSKLKQQTKESGRVPKAGWADPTNIEHVLKSVIKNQMTSAESFEKMSKKNEERVQKLNISITDQNQQIAQLKKRWVALTQLKTILLAFISLRLKDLEQKTQELESQNSELTKTNQLLNEKNATVYGKYVSLEVDYDQKIERLHFELNKQKTSFLAQQKRVEDLLNEVINQLKLLVSGSFTVFFHR